MSLPERFSAYQPQSPCNLCGQRNGTLVAVRDRHGKPIRVTCCKSCGLTYVDPLPGALELAAFYAQRYRREYKSVEAPRVKHIYRAGCVALDRFRTVALLAQPPARVLDCGAGGGEFAYLLTSRGYRLTGIEPNDGYREFARTEYGVDLRPGTLDDASFAAGEFDLITIFHVLEHLRDPRAALTKLAGWLRPGGYLYVEVPNALTEVSSPLNLYHRAHLYYFAAEPLARLACTAGLAPVLLDGAASKANLTAVFCAPTAAQASRRSLTHMPPSSRPIGAAHSDATSCRGRRGRKRLNDCGRASRRRAPGALDGGDAKSSMRCSKRKRRG